MDDLTYIDALYHALLGRAADPAGLASWTRLLQDGGDPRNVLAGILGSEEYRLKQTGPGVTHPAAVAAIVKQFGRRINIIDVGAQNLSFEKHVYQALCTPGIPHHVTGFEPLNDKLQERAAGADSCLTMLPYAVGDGSRHTLHVNNEDSTSSLFPLNMMLNQHFEHISGLRTVRHETVETRRLDEVLPPGPVDYLKLDVQGAEDMVLRGAEAVLARTAVIHCEVEFSAIYEGQPLYPVIQDRLDRQGFELIDLLPGHRYSYNVPSGRRSNDRLMWGDAVFFREEGPSDMLLAQALVALLVYGKASLGEHLLARHDIMSGTSLAPLMKH
jgi:FkbM family methyltransferase